MTDKQRAKYEGLLAQGRQYQKTGNPNAFRRDSRMVVLCRCPVCQGMLTPAGDCCECGEYRKSWEVH